MDLGNNNQKQTDEDSDLALVKSLQERAQKELEKCEPKRLKPSPIPASVREEALRQIEAERRTREATDRWTRLIERIGQRYANCRLVNFDCQCDRQSQVVASLQTYCANIVENVRKGTGIVLFGPRGTGKDHLATAVSLAAVRAGFTCDWVNGIELYCGLRDAISQGESEMAYIRSWITLDVLYISDPLPPVGELTEFQAGVLFRMLDRRYRQKKPTICTVNVVSGTELDQRMGPQNSDRLRDGAVAIYCDWPSYRAAIKV